MKKIVKNFLPLGKILGFGIVAKDAGASYQTVSKFSKRADNDKPNTKKRICDAMIKLGEAKIIELQQQVEELKQWKAEFLPNE